MKRVMVGTAGAVAWLAVSATPACGQEWRVAVADGGTARYVDIASVQREGDDVRYWAELRLNTPQVLANGASVDRIAEYVFVNCREMTFRSEQREVLLGAVSLSGRYRPDEPPDHARPGTRRDIELRAVCFGEWPKYRATGA